MPVYVLFSSDNKYAYVANQGQSSISVIDTETFKIIKVIDVSDNPIYMYLDK
jgi:YVTN family beta-propeller protein